MASNKRTVLITGCSAGGIGAALAIEYQKRPGVHVFATARNVKKIPASLANASNVTVLPLDTVSQLSIDDAVQNVSKMTGGKLDVLINNSGAALSATVLDTDLDAARNMFEVNVFGTLRVTKSFVDLLVHGKDATLVNNSSINGDINLPFSGVYGGSKAAGTIISETLRLEIQPLGIRVVTLHTGIIETNLHHNESAHAMPADSYYKIFEDFLEGRRSGANRPPATKADVYAATVVSKIEAGAKGSLFAGFLAPLIQYVHWWMPSFIFDRIMLNSGPKNWQRDLAQSVKGKLQ